MRLQKLVVMMALTGAISSANVSALGLGEVKLHSSLNQPLMAEIELLQVKDLTRTEILPNLAGRSDFERAGVKRPSTLTDLIFKTQVDESTGKTIIKIVSTKPIQEPYLNFLMEVHWPSGRLLREYTLLLDPPSFSAQPPAQVTTAVIQDYPVEREVPAGTGYLPVPKDVSNKTRSPSRQVPDQRTQSEISRSPRNTSSRNGRYTVQRNDTLWEIAQQVKPGNDLSVQQTMLAIQRANPQAFMDNNINRLKRGEVLRMPDRRNIEKLSPREAIARVSRQNRAWYSDQERQRVVQLDATRRTSTPPESPGSATDGTLAIVSADSSEGQGQDLGGNRSANNNGAIQTELAMTREQLDKLSRENAELINRMKDLDDQIATLKRLATLKDDQMAALQTQVARAEQQSRQPSASDPETGQMAEQGVMGTLFGNPLFMILLALFPLGLVGGLLYRRRQKQQDMEDEDEDEDEDSDPVDLVNTSSPDLTEQAESNELDFDSALEIDESLLVDDELTEETAQQTEDAISEADIYIAYGRFNQAADLLKQAVEVEPERSDLRLKLLEVHGENNDLDGFREALDGLEALGDADALQKADIFKTRFPGESFNSSSNGSSVNGVANENTVDDLAVLELDLNGDDEPEGLDDLDSEFDDAGAPPPPPPSLGDDLEDDEELPDIDLDDLDLDLDSDEPVAADTSAAFSDDEESSLEVAINDDDLDFLSEDDEVATKLDLARAYMDMGDMDGAKDILQEVVEQGSDEQKAEAQALIDQVK